MQIHKEHARSKQNREHRTGTLHGYYEVEIILSRGISKHIHLNNLETGTGEVGTDHLVFTGQEQPSIC